MPASREQIYAALKAADASGNIEDAKRLAKMYAATSAAPTPAPEKPRKSILGLVGNLGMDTAEALKGAMQQFGPEGLPAQAVMHPVKTAHAFGDMATNAADILTGAMQRTRELSPQGSRGSAPAMDTKAFDKFVGGIKDKWGSPEAAGNSVYEHPLAPVMTVASVVAPVLRAPAVAERIAAARQFAEVRKITKTPTPPPTTVALKTSATNLYEKAKKSGVVIDGQSFANFGDDVALKMHNEGLDLHNSASEKLYPKTTAALKTIKDTGGDVSLNDLERLRRVAGDAAGTTDKADRRLARILQDEITNYPNTLKPHNIIAGDAPKAVRMLERARKTWTDAARGEAIDKLIEKAKMNGGSFNSSLDGAYRAAFKKLANNERGMAQFTKEQQAAIRKVAFGEGKVQSALHTVGRIIPSNNTGVLTTSGLAAAAGLAGVPVAGPVGAMIAGAGIGGKIGSTLITARNAKRASELARGGSKITTRSEAYYQIKKRAEARAKAAAAKRKK